MPWTIAVFTGLPGTGKSTLSESLGRRLGAPVFSGDWLLGSMKPAHEQLARLDRATYLELYESVIEGLLARQLILCQSAVVDCAVGDATIRRWSALTREYGAAFVVVECVCSDRQVHRSRVEGRVRGIPGWHEIDWDHVERMRASLPPPTAERLIVDAANALDQNEARVWDYVTSVAQPPAVDQRRSPPRN